MRQEWLYVLFALIDISCVCACVRNQHVIILSRIQKKKEKQHTHSEHFDLDYVM